MMSETSVVDVEARPSYIGPSTTDPPFVHRGDDVYDIGLEPGGFDEAGIEQHSFEIVQEGQQRFRDLVVVLLASSCCMSYLAAIVATYRLITS
jgi:hypothetical protein